MFRFKKLSVKRDITPKFNCLKFIGYLQVHNFFVLESCSLLLAEILVRLFVFNNTNKNSKK